MGYSNALSFKKINNSKIKDVESFVQQDLMEIIQRKCQQSNKTFNEVDKAHFFGINRCDHTKFQFDDYEKAFIAKLVCHVQRVFDDNDGPAYFSEMNDANIVWSNEWFFKTFPAESVNNIEHLDKKISTHTHRILNKLLETANKNSTTSKGGYRFDDELMSYAAYFRMLAGPLAYKTLQNNLPLALPSVSSTNRFIRKSHRGIIEGQLRCDELLTYLEERGLPLIVSLSEDSTRIINRVQYDASTNQLIGFVLPKNENGVSNPFSYKARSASEIIGHYSRNNPISSFVTTIMATPLGNAPSFCLSIFGCNGKFTANDVERRWKFVKAELIKRGITAITFASDSDPRYNSTMRKTSRLGEPSKSKHNEKWFFAGNNSDPPFNVQDTIHILTKLRNFFLKTKGKTNASKLRLGKKYCIRADHLQYLMDHVRKDKHFLTKTTLNPIDRQNFASVKKMCNQRVLNLLKQHVKDSEATVKFLSIMCDIMDAFMDDSISPQQRIRKMWKSIFFLRLWRRSVVQNKSLTLKNNFLTANCYSCIELNGHSLLRIISFLNKTNQPHLFMPTKFNSQPCEKFYRQIRSFTTVYSTVVNCTVKEALGRVQKIQLQNHISASNSQFNFPKNLSSNQSNKLNTFALPTETEIVEIIEDCKNCAIEDAIEIGLLTKRAIDIPCEIIPHVTKPTTTNIRKQFAAMTISHEKTEEVNLKNIDLKNFAHKFNENKLKETGPYVEIIGSKKRLIVKKNVSLLVLKHRFQ